jgi:hypothetical protein
VIFPAGLNAGTGVAVGYGADPTYPSPLGIASGWQAGIVATAGSAEKFVPATLAVFSAVAATVAVAVDTGVGFSVAFGVSVLATGEALGAATMREGVGGSEGDRGVLAGDGATVFARGDTGVGEAGTAAVRVASADAGAVGKASGRPQAINRPIRHPTATNPKMR